MHLLRFGFSGEPLRWALLYLVIGLPCMIFMAVWVPLNEAPDEWSGIVRADSLRRGQIVGARLPFVDALGHPVSQAGVRADWSLLKAAFVFPPDAAMASRSMLPAVLERQRAIPWDGRTTLMMVANTAPYMPLLYAPGALGLAIGEGVGLGPYDAMRLGRVLTAICCALLGGAALWVAPRGHPVLLAALVMPMSLSLGASYNMDGMLIAVATFAAGCLLRAELGAKRWLWLSVLALAVLVAAKPPYAPLVLAVIIPTRSDAGRLRDLAFRAGLAAVAVLPGLIWLVFITAQVATDFLSAEPYHPGILWQGGEDALFTTIDRRAQTEILLRHPMLALSLPWNDLRGEGGVLLRQMIGVLAQLSLALSEWAYRLWHVALPASVVAACLVASKPKVQSPSIGAALAWVGILASIAAVVLSQYVSWTKVGAESVAGVQGRYFLPVLAFLPLALPRIACAGAALTLARRAAVTATAVAAVSAIFILPRLVLSTYYP